MNVKDYVSQFIVEKVPIRYRSLIYKVFPSLEESVLNASYDFIDDVEIIGIPGRVKEIQHYETPERNLLKKTGAGRISMEEFLKSIRKGNRSTELGSEPR
jgi:hypothetical protein